MHAAFHLQPSLFDAADGAATALGGLAGLRLTALGDGAWVDVLPGWLAGPEPVVRPAIGCPGRGAVECVAVWTPPTPSTPRRSAAPSR